MACQHCNGTRVLRVNAKTSDMFTARMSGIDYDGMFHVTSVSVVGITSTQLS